MLENEGAGAQGNEGQSGSGAPEGGSPEGGSENDDKPITAKQLKAALDSQRRHYEGELQVEREKFEAFKAGAGSRKKDEPDQPKRYTRAQLRAMVDQSQITHEQADDQWALQVREEAREEATAAARDTVTRQATKERVDADLKSYKRLKPEIMERGSEVREEIAEAYRRMVSRGSPETESTELAAIESVLGPLNKLEKAAKAPRSEDHEQQGGGQGGDGKPKPGAGKKLVDHLKGDAKDYYDRGIKQGRYKDWGEVEAELKFASPKTRSRLGLPA